MCSLRCFNWIRFYKDRDATEVMYGFHSDKAMDMMKRLPKAKSVPEGVAPMSKETMNFRKWRADLVEQGWWKREWKHEAFNLGSWAVWLTAGIMLAQFQVLHMQFLAATVLGISNTIAGWLSHDYVHGRGKFADFMVREWCRVWVCGWVGVCVGVCASIFLYLWVIFICTYIHIHKYSLHTCTYVRTQDVYTYIYIHSGPSATSVEA